MIQWSEDGKQGQFDRYEVLVLMQDNGTWSSLIWVRKTFIDRLENLPSKEAAQLQAEERIDRLYKDVKRLESQLYDPAEDDVF